MKDFISRKEAIEGLKKTLMFRMKPDLAEHVKKYLESLPEAPESAVNQTECVDRINLTTAIENPVWMAVWAAEPDRKVDVRMTYEDLRIICDIAKEIHNKAISKNKEKE